MLIACLDYRKEDRRAWKGQAERAVIGIQTSNQSFLVLVISIPRNNITAASEIQHWGAVSQQQLVLFQESIAIYHSK